MNIQDAIKYFLDYTEPYNDISDMCVLKVDHTMRVMNLCERIAKSIGLNEEDVELAKLCGLLHDIGRFEQWKNFETFDDSKSIDHASLGTSILEENNWLQDFLYDEEKEAIVKNSVFYHNKFKIYQGLPDRYKMFCNIVRDADKIDILYLYTIKHIHPNTKDKAFSENIYEALMQGREIKKNEKKTKADTLAVSLGFIFDINFKESIEILKSEDYLNQEIDMYLEKTQNEEFKHQLIKVKEKINNYMEERLTC